MLKLSKYFLFLFVIAIFSIGVDAYTNPASCGGNIFTKTDPGGGRCCPYDTNWCSGAGKCYYPSDNECCLGSSVGYGGQCSGQVVPSCSESCGAWSQTVNGQECGQKICNKCNPARAETERRECPSAPACAESCEAWSQRGFNGEECGQQVCHKCNPGRDETSERTCSVIQANFVVVPIGSLANDVCRNSGFEKCVKVQSKNNPNKVYEDISHYSCSDKIGASGYGAVCEGVSTVECVTKYNGCSTPGARAECCQGLVCDYSYVCLDKLTQKPASEKGITVAINLPSKACEDKCSSLGKDKGGCYPKNGLPENIFGRAHNFFVFGDLDCRNNQGCYCWSESDERAAPVSVVLASPDSLSIGLACSEDPQCVSGFCGIGSNKVCFDRCQGRSNFACGSDNKCMLYPSCEGSSCSGISRGCINRGAYDSLTSKMVQMLSGSVDKNSVRNDMKNILDQYNLDVANLENDVRNSLSRVTGSAVKINTKENGCPDFNTDTNVNFDDFFLFADNFGFAVDNANKKFDLGNNNIVDFDDFFKFADYFGQSVQCYTPTCNDNEANLPGEIRMGDYSCGGECGPCQFEELREKNADPIEIIGKTGECRDGVCNFKLKAVGRYSGRGELKVKLIGDDYDDKIFGIRITGGTIKRFASLLTGTTVLDITSFAVNNPDAVYQDVNNPQRGSKSRFECGLKLDPGFCCPAGYQTSSDGSRCVLVESEIRYCADFDRDGNVNYVDFFILADEFGREVNETNSSIKSDLDRSGNVGFDDFFLFADEFGKEPSC